MVEFRIVATLAGYMEWEGAERFLDWWKCSVLIWIVVTWIYSCIKAKMTILVRLNTEAPMGSTLQSLSSRCRSQSCDLAPVWMDGVAWTCGSENSGRWPCILTWSLNHSTHIYTVHHQHLLSWNTLQGQEHHLWQFIPNTLVYYNITHVSHIVYHNA